MNPMHWHLVLNHSPFLLLLVGLGLLQAGVFRRSRELKLAGLWIMALGGLAGLPVFLSGEGAEEIAERLLALPEAFVERHEESAERSLWALLLAAAASSWALWRSRRRQDPPRGLTSAAAFLAVVAAASTAWTGYLGGQLRHPEVQPDWQENARLPDLPHGPRGEP